ncbi:MAG TPA: prolyl oligopeptidase family serine peptidase [Vicinamibacterales bacterium]|jgi:dienelactone hydrolase
MPSIRTRARKGVIPLGGLWLVLVAALAAAAPGTKTITFQDLMKFRAIEKPVISDDGKVLAYGLQPDRGDGEAIVQALAGGKVVKVPLGGSPVISKNGRWVALVVKPSFAASEKAGKDKPKPGMALVDVSAASVVTTVESVDKFALSDDSKWLAYLLSPSEPAKPAGGEAAKPAPPTNARKDDARKPGGTLKLRDLATGAEMEIPKVASFAFDPASKFLAYVVSADEGKGNGVFVRPLTDATAAPAAIVQADNGRYDMLTWSKDGALLAFLTGVEKPAASATLMVFDATTRQSRQVASSEQAPAGWILPLKNDLAWSKDRAHLFFGFKPQDPAANQSTKTDKPDGTPDPYDTDALLAKVEGDVWHWNDPRIIPQQKLMWEREKDRTYRAVLHVDTGKIVPLANIEMPDVAIPDNPRVALGTSDVPYLKQTTWDERRRDLFIVDLDTGARRLAVKALRDQASMSPDGKWFAYFGDRQWHLVDCTTPAGTSKDVAIDLGVTLVDEEHDTPDAPPSYGFGGWVDQGASFLVYDRYDIWQIPTAGGPTVNITGRQGRAREVTFRVVTLDAESKSFSSREPLLLTAYHNKEKNWGFYAASIAKPGVDVRLDEKKSFKFVAKARNADVLLYTREDFGEFPDVWATDSTFKQPRKVSAANPQLADFAWGTAELVDYKSLDGVALQGVLIKPANYKPGTRYPVITYFYERQSQRLYEFNEPVVNHRPSFSVYAGAGYAVFLPDIVFTVGHPGQSMLRCLVPAVQRLVDMGVADPKALGLHGHSWGGYGTAYVVTQTDMFAAAVTGAPVANMTSAYGGIRWESGQARLFQYEKTQSRIGGTLWEKRDLFLENSALFYADRVKTPLLIEHGDEDGAVPWYQGIELYLALRRLGKDCIFLQYRGEPHHLKKYPNKLDYSIKMKQYFDHYLKGEPAADWITNGVPYRGR